MHQMSMCQRECVKEYIQVEMSQSEPAREILSEKFCWIDPITESLSERTYQRELDREKGAQQMCQCKGVREIISESVLLRIRVGLLERVSEMPQSLWERMSENVSETIAVTMIETMTEIIWVRYPGNECWGFHVSEQICYHRPNTNLFGSNRQSSQTLWSISPALVNNAKCPEVP